MNPVKGSQIDPANPLVAETLALLLWNAYGATRWNSLAWHDKNDADRLRWRYDAKRILHDLQDLRGRVLPTGAKEAKP